MKKKSFGKKLALNKATVSNLDRSALESARGGLALTQTNCGQMGCHTHEFPGCGFITAGPSCPGCSIIDCSDVPTCISDCIPC